jgi:phage terminase large subunit GpA-like protein
LRWPQFRYDNNDPATVRYLCGDVDRKTGELRAGCGEPITEDRKAWMIERGEWVAARAGRPIRGYHIWAAYSLFSSWQNIVQQWLDAQGDNEKLQVFVNTVLGETWQEGEPLDHDVLKARAEVRTAEAPVWCAALTAGVDVQGDRIEVSIWGWGPGSPPESGVIRHEVLWGDPAQATTWGLLDLVLFRDYQHACGAKLRVLATCVDSGGHHTDAVYRYCRARRKNRVYAIKGASEPGRAPVPDLQAVAKSKGPVMLGTIAIKDTLFSRLRVPGHGPGYVHFPMLGAEFFRQLASETRRFKYEGRRPVHYYVETYERHEALDCAVYAYAALLLLGPVRDQLGTILEQLQAAAAGRAPGPTVPRRRVRSAGIDPYARGSGPTTYAR